MPSASLPDPSYGPSCWASTWQRQREQRAKSPLRASASSSEDRYKREQEKRDRDEARCTAALPAIFKALAEKVKRSPAGVKGPLRHGAGPPGHTKVTVEK